MFRNDTKNQADKLLLDIQLVEVLNKQGIVHFTGSYYLDVMVPLDIDIHVLANDYNRGEYIQSIHAYIEKHENICESFISHKKGFEEFATNLDIAPLGTYVGLGIKYGGKYWKLDIWYYEKGCDPVDSIGMSMKYKKVLDSNPKKRYLITKLKKEVYDFEARKYQSGFSGAIIYDGVLYKGLQYRRRF